MKKHLCVLLFLVPVILSAQPQYSVMNYNLLNYPGNDTTIRNPYFRTTIAATLPDVLVCQEMNSQAGVDGFLNNVLLPVYAGYTAGTFIDGPDTDNEIFYKTDYFTFISNTAIPTDLRNISEFKLVENASGDTIRIYSVHLKASTGSSNEQQRLAEVNVLRSVTDTLPEGTFFMVTGDFNIYASTEPAYTALLDQSTPGYFVDLFDLPGVWNDAAYAPYHTQSTRTRQFGGGATGGLDDRFDMILMSQSIIDTGGVHYVYDSYVPYGNDGLHYNDSINQPPNLAVGQEIADALHYSSDHLPVIINLRFDSVIPVELISFTASAENSAVRLNWMTGTETNNKGFEIQRSEREDSFGEVRSQPVGDEVSPKGGESEWKAIGFLNGNGTTASSHSYSYTNKNLLPGKYLYRLKQEDFDGGYKFSSEVGAEVSAPMEFTLEQNYPNPFNPGTIIKYQIKNDGYITMKIYNPLGEEVITLVNGYMKAGEHSVEFDGSKIAGGVYIYRLTAAGYSSSRKLLLLK